MIDNMFASPDEVVPGAFGYLQKLDREADDWYSENIKPDLDQYEVQRMIWDYAHGDPKCDHEKKHIVYKLNRVGRKMFRWQCPECGEYLSEWLKMTSDKGIPEEQVRDYARESRIQSQIYDRLISRFQNEKKSSWWNWYNAYLRTPEWAAKRNAVMQRANGKCEGCGKKPPTAVHHLTYAHAGNELLFELAALCTECHRKAHEKRKGQS